MTTTNRPIFEETQSFLAAPLMRLAVGGSLAICATVAVMMYAKGDFDNMAPRESILAWMILATATPCLLMALFRLTTTVDNGGVHLYFRGLWRRHVSSAEIVSLECHTYHPIRDYGGWGIRWGGWKKWAYNVMGNEGVLLHLEDGGTLLIGSQRSAELEAALNKVIGRRRGM